MTALQQVLDEIAVEAALASDRGVVAQYIPELAKVDPGQFGIAVALPDGQVFCAGDAGTAFSIQSVSKVFTLSLALGKLGDALWSRVGREPSGNPFNSIVQLEQEKGRPRNPFINAGAIVLADLILAGHQPREAIGEIVRFMRYLADDDAILIDERVARSETDRVGLPGKSGVGGGILAIAPGKASIAVWSPGLDTVGNSKLGTLALEQLAKRMEWSVFGA